MHATMQPLASLFATSITVRNQQYGGKYRRIEATRSCIRIVAIVVSRLKCSLSGARFSLSFFFFSFFSFFPSFHEHFHERGTVAVPVTGVHAQGQLDLWHNKAVTQSVGGTRVVNFIYDLLESWDSSRFFGGASSLLVKSKGERSNSVQFSSLEEGKGPILHGEGSFQFFPT